MNSIHFQKLYLEMFQAKQAGNSELAETLMLQMEELRNSQLPKPSLQQIQSVTSQLPAFAIQVLDKSAMDLNSTERANCINAAFNFHDLLPHWEPYSTMNFLERIQTGFFQLLATEDFQLGDLAVMWSRTGGSWDDQAIDVHKINPADPDFPYGLVFDHVAVRLSEDLVFHKPDPTLESRYQIDFIDSALVPTALNCEMTYHRPLSVG